MLLMSIVTQSNSQGAFDARIKKVRHSHTRMARGYDAKVGRDGLIVFRPKRRRRSVPIRALFVAITAFFGFKVLVLLSLGDIAYQERVDTLAVGSIAEQAGAYVMQIDPVARTIAEQLAPLL
jgi:hypothetical protein